MTSVISLNERVEQEVAALGDLSREELAARWQRAFGCPPPKGVKRGLLERAAAWQIQARYFGGLSPTARKAIRDAIRQGRNRSPEQPGLKRFINEVVSPSPKGSRSKPAVAAPVRPGTRLVREWNGRTYIVDVGEDGFVFDGKTYRSLTAIAERITGAHWSGRRFFGL